MKITAETTVTAPIEEVWRTWTTPDDIKKWNPASDDWHTTAATVGLRVGGAFTSRIEAKDSSFGFDFAGSYTQVVPHKLIECSLGEPRANPTPQPDALAYGLVEAQIQRWLKRAQQMGSGYGQLAKELAASGALGGAAPSWWPWSTSPNLIPVERSAFGSACAVA